MAMPMPSDTSPPSTGTGSPLEVFGGRAETTARVHRLLAQRSETAVDLADFLRDVAQGLVMSQAPKGKVTLRFTGDAGTTPRERALTIGLIVGELVTNAVNFAHPTGIAGYIDIECRKSADGTVGIAVRDDGVGLPEELDPAKHGNSGLELVRTLAARLEATLTFHSDALGLSIALSIPAA